MTRILIGNLSGQATLVDLRSAFALFGPVTSAVITTNASQGRPERVGFIEMTWQAHAVAAIAALNGTDLRGTAMRVSRAAPTGDGGRRGNPPRGWDIARIIDGN